jgi:hypothetical protein
MKLNDAIRRYRRNRFTDEDVTYCTGLTVRSWRELIKHRAVKTTTVRRGPGRVRLCDATVFKRAAIISALNQAGLSLPVAGRIAYFLPFHTLLYAVCDPVTILLHGSAERDSRTTAAQEPIVDWFVPGTAGTANRETDWLIEIYDGRYVAAIYDRTEDGSAIFGDLRQDGTRFVAWLPAVRRPPFRGGGIEIIADELFPERFVDFIADWEDPAKWAMELKDLNYEFEQHDAASDALRMAAEATLRSPLITTTINITLALRKALRRYLGVEPAAPITETDDEA